MAALIMNELISKTGLETFISRPENLEALEDTLGWHGDLYLRLKRNESSLDLKTKIPSDRLAGLFKEVQRQTAETLDIDDFGKIWFSEYDWKFFTKVGLKRGAFIAGGAQLVSLLDGLQSKDLSVGPAVLTFFTVGIPLYALGEYTSGRLSSQRVIYLGFGDNTEASAALAFSRGLAYQLIHDKTYAVDENGPFTHGFIAGLGKVVGEKLSEQHNNPAYHYQFLKSYTGELKDAYLTFCEKKGIASKNSLAKLEVPSPRWVLDKIPFFYQKGTYSHSLATATLGAAEMRFGEGIYKNVLAEDFSFLRR